MGLPIRPNFFISLLFAGFSILALAQGLVAEHCCGDGDIQGIHLAKHRNLYLCCGDLSPVVCKPLCLATHYDGCRKGHINVVVVAGILQLCCKNLEPPFKQPLSSFSAGAGDYSLGKERAKAGADKIGVEEVASGVA